MKIWYGIFLFMFFAGLGVLKAQKTDTIVWQPERSLNWMDYKGIPDQESHYSALTHAEIKYKVSMQRSFAKFDFATFFLKKTSWTKHTQDPLLLKHEQIHFDIAELHKRLFIEILSNRTFFYQGLETEVKRLGDSINTARHRMDNEFDIDVANMRDHIKVNRWSRLITDAMDRLRSYNRNSILIALQ